MEEKDKETTNNTTNNNTSSNNSPVPTHHGKEKDKDKDNNNSPGSPSTSRDPSKKSGNRKMRLSFYSSGKSSNSGSDASDDFLQISEPYNFRQAMHVEFDKTSGALKGAPEVL